MTEQTEQTDRWLAAILTVARRTEHKVDRLTQSHSELKGQVTSRFNALDKWEGNCENTRANFWKEINFLKTWKAKHNGVAQGMAMSGDKVQRWAKLALGAGFLLLAFLTGDATDAIDALRAWIAGP